MASSTGVRKRRSNRRRRDYLRLARSLLVAFVIFELLQGAFASPRLAVRSVHVEGARELSPEHVRALAGVKGGANIFAVNLGDVRRRLLRDPVVQEAMVSRSLPGTIRVEVRERTAQMAATWGGRFWEVDRAGIPYRELPEAPPGLSVLDLESGAPPQPGVPLPAERWQAVRQCSDLAGKNRLLLRKILFDDHGELWLNIPITGQDQSDEELLAVRLGRTEDLPEKMAQLRWVLPQASSDGGYLDLMCPGRAAFRKGATGMRGGATSLRRAVAPAPAVHRRAPAAPLVPPRPAAVARSSGGLLPPP